MSTARERSPFGQFQLNRSGLNIGVDYTKVKRTSTFDMAKMLRDGATLADTAEAFGLSVSTVQQRLSTAGWSAATGQPLDTFTEPDVEAPRPAFAFIDQPWISEALCAQIDTEIFFPDKGGSTREAKKVCASCFVAAECLGYALDHNERFGIWGGLSERDRRKLQGHAVPCPQCTDLFASEVNRDRHLEQRHRPPKNPVTCPDCGRVFAHSGAMFSHARVDHPDTERTAS